MGKDGWYADASHGHIGVVTNANNGTFDFVNQNLSGKYVEECFGYPTSAVNAFLVPNFGGSPIPTNPVFTINDVSNITETNAYISCSKITNPNGGTMTRVGFQMGTSSGNYSINKYDDLPSWLPDT